MQTDLITKVYFNEHLTHSCVGMPQGLQALSSSFNMKTHNVQADLIAELLQSIKLWMPGWPGACINMKTHASISIVTELLAYIRTHSTRLTSKASIILWFIQTVKHTQTNLIARVLNIHEKTRIGYFNMKTHNVQADLIAELLILICKSSRSSSHEINKRSILIWKITYDDT